jgi:hypothetical protein
MSQDNEVPNTYPIANIAAILLQRRKASSVQAAIRTAYNIWTHTTIFLDGEREKEKLEKAKARKTTRRKPASPVRKTTSPRGKRTPPSEAS